MTEIANLVWALLPAPFSHYCWNAKLFAIFFYFSKILWKRQETWQIFRVKVSILSLFLSTLMMMKSCWQWNKNRTHSEAVCWGLTWRKEKDNVLWGRQTYSLHAISFSTKCLDSKVRTFVLWSSGLSIDLNLMQTHGLIDSSSISNRGLIPFIDQLNRGIKY